MPKRLDDLMQQLRDPSRWPPLPERPLVPATLEDLRRAVLTADDLKRWMWSPPINSDDAPVKVDPRR
jgi:hypothetical protein